MCPAFWGRPNPYCPLLMYPLLRSFLFRLDPERAHALTLSALGAAGSLTLVRWIMQLAYAAPSKPVTAFGLEFKNPIGLAAGYDKDGIAVRGLAALGFGHIEVGTVTPLAQTGNPKPRLFRLVEDEAIINRMGFPSRGSAYLQRRLSPEPVNWMAELVGLSGRRTAAQSARSLRRTAGCIIGVNIGKNTATANDQAVFDYLALLQNFAAHADYLTINVSSPNTAGLRDLQGRKALEGLLTELHAQRQIEQERIKRRLPLLVKLSPDLADAQLDEALDVLASTRMDGVILTNTTLARGGLKSAHRAEQGGLSGSPLRERSEAILRSAIQHLAGAIAVVSAGGIMTVDDVKRRLDLGAALVQVYTGLVYRGPGLVKQTVKSL
jgi:dihydroorotate dehydrogenase